MNFRQLKIIFGLSLITGVMQSANAHGYIEKPASRNYFCGVVTKPDQIIWGNPPYKSECAAAFGTDPNNQDGYQFMSIVSHTKGAKEVRPLPKNVCGFDSEAFNKGKENKETIWDKPIDWPTTKMKPGTNEFIWDIHNGPHFSDTDHFRYWITKPNFKYQVGKPLKWSDFESTPFCERKWTGHSVDNIKSHFPAENKFWMSCEVPERHGRQVIYGEWGRTPATYERFHSCMDVVMDGTPDEDGAVTTPVVPVIANLAIKPNLTELSGEGIVTLDASGSIGKNLTYYWNINTANSSLYKLQNANSPTAQLYYKNPTDINNLSISLLVSNDSGKSTGTITLSHKPVIASPWKDLGQLTREAKTLNVGDKVSVRVVLKNGHDAYYPANGLVITDAIKSASEWPYSLATEINKLNRELMLGQRSGNQIVPVRDATSNKIFATESSHIQNAYLWVTERSGGSKCLVKKQNGSSPWWAGFEIATDQAEIDLNFAGTGIDLTKVSIDPGAFKVTVNGSELHLVKQSWVTSSTFGYLGMNANNYQPLVEASLPKCN